MDEIDVDAICAQTAQAGLQRRPQMIAGRTLVVGAGPGREIELAGDHHVAAAIPDEPPQDLLGAPPSIDIGAIEEIDSRFAAAPKDDGGNGFVRLLAERHRSEAKGRNLQPRPAEKTMLHRRASEREIGRPAGREAQRDAL